MTHRPHRQVSEDEMLPVTSVAQIPDFQDECEEHDYWATHYLDGELLESMRPRSANSNLPSPRARTRPVAVRFDGHTLSRLRTVARKKGKGYQTLLKEFVSERLYEEEKREGLIPS